MKKYKEASNHRSNIVTAFVGDDHYQNIKSIRSWGILAAAIQKLYDCFAQRSKSLDEISDVKSRLEDDQILIELSNELDAIREILSSNLNYKKLRLKVIRAIKLVHKLNA